MTMNWASQLIFTEAGYMFINGGNNLIHKLTMKDPGPKESFYHMARIDYGIFRLYNHPIREDTTGCGSCSSLWTEVQRIPDNICGKGLCGPNSICNITDNGMAFCTCPLNFSPLDNGVGCKPNFALPSCHNEWDSKELVEFEELKHVDWEFSDYNLFKDLGWKKQYPLANGRQNPNRTSIALIKVARSNGSTKKDQSLVVLLAILLGSSGFLNFLFFLASFVAVFFLYNKKLNSPRNTDRTLGTNVRSYTYKELEEATRGFKQTVGKGAFGTVYKGVLQSNSKRFVAVKKLGKADE
ncbi:G-type lectin S-receptor-like serine/threonine-protein kinase LECRK4 [Quercus suber]|uniref:G-type lectin S-receptor-like serine/threonine-protein kinase LECRK4 n=1 Tax=Quercus suber TaxID=58331 RepID=UPI0032DFA86E